jgi:hypothetical protein
VRPCQLRWAGSADDDCLYEEPPKIHGPTSRWSPLCPETCAEGRVAYVVNSGTSAGTMSQVEADRCLTSLIDSVPGAVCDTPGHSVARTCQSAEYVTRRLPRGPIDVLLFMLDRLLGANVLPPKTTAPFATQVSLL